jgi:hypothetical protein
VRKEERSKQVDRSLGGASLIALVTASRGFEHLIAQARDAGEVEVWAPLGMLRWLEKVPGPVGRFAAKRSIEADVRGPLVLADAALRAWARDATDRRYRSEFALRLAIDRWAARQVRKRKPNVVIASSLAARETFAAAREIGARCVLAIDLPMLRALHRDLDRAAEHWPERAFLRRFRAPSWAIARQDTERVLADLILVRGPYARAINLADGIPAARLATLPQGPGPALAMPLQRTHRIRLAGLAAARHGIDTALAAAARLGVALVVRAGEGTEPVDLTSRPGVATDDGPVDAIVCPAICETYAPELRAIGVPVIASPMASIDGRGPDPYDAKAFADAIALARSSPVDPMPSIAPLLAAFA